MNIFNRRRFLKTSSLAFSALGLNMVAPTMFQKRMEAAAMANNKQRGGYSNARITVSPSNRPPRQPAPTAC